MNKTNKINKPELAKLASIMFAVSGTIFLALAFTGKPSSAALAAMMFALAAVWSVLGRKRA